VKFGYYPEDIEKAYECDSIMSVNAELMDKVWDVILTSD
jgi:hypothetical protein